MFTITEYMRSSWTTSIGIESIKQDSSKLPSPDGATREGEKQKIVLPSCFNRALCVELLDFVNHTGGGSLYELTDDAEGMMGRKKKRAGRGRVALSLVDLERMIAQQQSDLQNLQTLRAKLQTQIDQADADIAAIQGSGNAPAPRRVGRPRLTESPPSPARKPGKRGPRGAGNSLEDYIRRELKQASGPMKLSDIRAAVQSAGYVSTSKTFGVIVGQRLAGMSDVSKAGRGMYKMGGGSAATSGAKKKKRKAKRKARRAAK